MKRVHASFQTISRPRKKSIREQFRVDRERRGGRWSLKKIPKSPFKGGEDKESRVSRRANQPRVKDSAYGLINVAPLSFVRHHFVDFGPAKTSYFTVSLTPCTAWPWSVFLKNGSDISWEGIILWRRWQECLEHAKEPTGLGSWEEEPRNRPQCFILEQKSD